MAGCVFYMMKFLFIIQGEGRGHLTQAMTLERLLTGRGHKVVRMMVGKSPQRNLPDFFVKGVSAPVEQFESLNFVPSSSHKRASMFKTVVYNAFELYKIFPSARRIRDVVASESPDVIINFYELMAGIANFMYDLKAPVVSIGHQYLFLHKDFRLSRRQFPGLGALNLFSRLTSLKSVERLALSFRSMAVDERHSVVPVPPLLRPEVLALKPEKGEYIHGYLLNYGFAQDVMEWHMEHPDVDLRFFWDNWEAGKVKKVDDNLTFYLIDDKEFLRQMSGCKAYATTAGFESVCEAMYLGKPVLMVPSHIEQDINAFDAICSGAGVSCGKFDLSMLMKFAEGFTPDAGFRTWADSAAGIILRELESIVDKS